MATTGLRLTVEMDEMGDAIVTLQEIHSRLAKKHGDEFRRLDRAIEQFVEEPGGGVKVHWLGGGKLIAAPDGVLTDIFREARRLGVLD